MGFDMIAEKINRGALILHESETIAGWRMTSSWSDRLLVTVLVTTLSYL